jgi:hypothetical protein
MPQYAAMKRIGVVPGSALDARSELLAALEAIYGVRFERRDPGQWRGLDGVVAFSGGESVAREAFAAGLSALAQAGGSGPGPNAAAVTLADEQLLDRRLRGQIIDDERAGASEGLRAAPGSAVLASSDGKALWVAREEAGRRCDLVARLVDETDSKAPVASLLTAGRFLSLLPLAHFLRALAADSGWQSPRPRAALVVDDPNLHAASYGYIDYPALARHALAHGYHVAMATVPLDGWLARRSAVEVFARHPGQLSLVVHGNDHGHHELARPESDLEAARLMAQGLRRVAALERRSGLRVGRVMIPPHERSSAASFRAMRRLGFEAAWMDWQCPWLGPVVRHGAELQLAGWHPAELLGGGLPVLARSYWTDPAPDLALRAFRGHPLVLYGHHEDAADLEVLAGAVQSVNRLGPVSWVPLPEIARSSFATRREGSFLSVRMFATRVCVEIPDGVETIRVETPLIHEHVEGTLAGCDEQTSALEPAGLGLTSGPLSVRAGERAELRLSIPGRLDPAELSPPRWRPWPLVRRGVTEGRDRLRPLLRERPAG